MSYMTRFHQFYFSVTVYTHSSTLPPFPLLILLLLLLLLLNHSLHEIKTTLCPRCVYTEPLECSSVRVPATATLVNPPAYIGQTPTDGQASCMQSRHRNQKARRFFSKTIGLCQVFDMLKEARASLLTRILEGFYNA